MMCTKIMNHEPKLNYRKIVCWGNELFVLQRAIRHAIAYEQKMEYPEQDIKQLKAMLEVLSQED